MPNLNSAHADLPGARRYFQAVQATLDAIVASQLERIDRAAALVSQTIAAGGLVYLFGTGHSHMLAEEGHYRAGGLAAVCPILSPALMLHDGAIASTALERTAGVSAPLVQRYQPTAQDLLFIFSNSGVNTAPVEAAQTAKALGLTVIAVISEAYAAQAPVGPLGCKLADLADLVLDNHGPPGDALVEVADTGLRTGPVSTIAGAFMLNAILTEATWRLAEQGQTPPVYISSNMPDAIAHNAALVEQYRPRNPHL